MVLHTVYMNYSTRFFSFLMAAILVSGCAVFNKSSINTKHQIVEVTTNYGVFKLKLYDDTPIHKKNFLSLVDSAYYDSLLFHRVIDQFMIQAGDPDSKGAVTGLQLGNGGPNYTLPAEFVPSRFHKKGVLAAAREGDDVNPEKRSSGSQFYIVTGRKFTAENLNQMSKNIDYNREMGCLQYILRLPENKEAYNQVLYYQNKRMGYKNDSIFRSFQPQIEKMLDTIPEHSFTEAQITAYTTVGGAPHLDGGYTVFGEVIMGMEVIDLISKQKTDNFDRPVADVIILGMKRVKS